MQTKYAKGRTGKWFVDADFYDKMFSLLADFLLA